MRSIRRYRPIDISWITRDGWLLLTPRIIQSFARSALVVLLAIYLEKQGLSTAKIGIFFTAGLAGGTFFAFILALKGDRLGRRRVMVYLTLAASLPGFALFATDDFLMLCTFAFLGSLAIGGGGGDPLQIMERAAMPETVTPEKRTDLFAIAAIFRNAASALGALSAGLPIIFQSAFGWGEVDSFKPIMLGYAILVALSAVMYALLSPKVTVAKPPKWVNPATLPHRGVIFRLSGLFALDSFGHGLVLESLVSLWFHNEFGLSIGSLAFLWFGWHLITASSFWIAARLAARIGHVNTIVFAHLPSNLFLIALPFAPTAWVAILLWQIRSFFQLMDSPVRNSYIVGIVPSEERVAMSAYTSISQTGATSVTPTVAGALWGVGSAAIPFVSAGIIRVTYDLLLWYIFHNLKTEEEKASEQEATSEQTPTEDRSSEVSPAADNPPAS